MVCNKLGPGWRQAERCAGASACNNGLANWKDGVRESSVSAAPAATCGGSGTSVNQ